MSTNLPPPDDAQLQLERLRQFLRWLIPNVFGFALLEVGAFAIFGHVPTGLTGAVIGAYGGLLLLAWRLVQRGTLGWAVALSCGGMLAAALLIVALLPDLFPTLSMIPLLAVAAALPYIGQRGLLRLSLACGLVITVVVLYGNMSAPRTLLPQTYTITFRVSSLVAVAGLVLLLLWQFSSRLNETLARTRTANEALRQAQARIEEQHENLAVTLRSIGDGVIATDSHGRVVLFNGVAERLTGWLEHETTGVPLQQIFRIVESEGEQPLPDPVAQVLSSGQVVELAECTTLIARDGTRHRIADSAAPIRSHGGLTRGVVLVFRDISERVRAEREQQALQQKLVEAQKPFSAAELRASVGRAIET